MVTGQGYGLGIGGYKGLSYGQQGIARLHFSLSVSIKDRSLHMTLGKSQIYCPKRILGYGHREDLLLSCRGSGSFRTD